LEQIPEELRNDGIRSNLAQARVQAAAALEEQTDDSVTDGSDEPAADAP
jgi:hypothetical protein